MLHVELAFYIAFLEPVLELPPLSEEDVPDHVSIPTVMHKIYIFCVL